MKIAAGIEYDGSQFCGWQKQKGLRTVQSAVEQAFSKVAAETIEVVCAGRTDTGVHAMNQVVHFESSVDRPIKSWLFGANSALPKDVSVRWVKVVADDFDARFSAAYRRYRYIIFNHPLRPAHVRGNLTWHYPPLNASLMVTEAQDLVGEHDFNAFRSSQCQSKSSQRCIHSIVVHQHQYLIMVDVEANAFLHHMVRNIVGVLLRIGSGQQQEGWMKTVLESRDRCKGAETAPPYGLYLLDVGYPAHFEIPSVVNMPLFFDVPFRTSSTESQTE